MPKLVEFERAAYMVGRDSQGNDIYDEGGEPVFINPALVALVENIYPAPNEPSRTWILLASGRGVIVRGEAKDVAWELSLNRSIK